MKSISTRAKKLTSMMTGGSVQALMGVPTVVHTKFSPSVMVLAIISNEGDMMALCFFEKGLHVNAAVYMDVLDNVVKT